MLRHFDVDAAFAFFRCCYTRSLRLLPLRCPFDAIDAFSLPLIADCLFSPLSLMPLPCLLLPYALPC